jgi:5-methylcytosine-specific restriction enzyme subunit McrC
LESQPLSSSEQILRTTERPVREIYATREHEAVDIPLDQLLIGGKLQIYPDIASERYFSISFRGDRLVFQAGGFVGLIPVNDQVAIDVGPRVPVGNLIRLLRIADAANALRVLPYERKYVSVTEWAPSLLRLLSRSLTEATMEIEAKGRHRQYVRIMSDTSFPRGRILIGETIQRHAARGIGHVVATSSFNHTVDTGPNRCLKYTHWYLARQYASISKRSGDQDVVEALNRAFHVFDGVSLDLATSFLKDPLVLDPDSIPDLRGYYRQPLRLAVTILNRGGIRFSRDTEDLRLESLIVRMSDVFESYVRNILAALAGVEQELRDFVILDGNRSGAGGAKKPLFDSSDSPPASPDIVIARGAESANLRFPIVIDTKYRPTLEPDRDDLNQVITYGVSYRASNVMLVYPRVENGPHKLRLVGRVANLDVYAYWIDLNAANLELEEQAFARALGGLAKVAH